MIPPTAPRPTSQDLYLFGEGTYTRLYETFGAHPVRVGDVEGTSFGVWAPNAQGVSVIGDFNHWTPTRDALTQDEPSGTWHGFVPGVRAGARYKYHVVSRYGGYAVDKADPCAFLAEPPPATASIVWDLAYDWQDRSWMETRQRRLRHEPMAIYELHLGSWARMPESDGRPLTYRELAERLPAYVAGLGFTHVELLPVAEHPFYGSWGYEVTGYFAPTARYGTPQDFMYLVDRLHQAGIGVILDWVASHFPGDEHGLVFFDGTHLYEHADPRRGRHPDWDTYVFNYGRNEVRSFLISNAMFWLDRYHIDGLRVDAVATMLYHDFGRRPGEWLPNPDGGRENLDAVACLRALNGSVHAAFPDVVTIAEESTTWPMVSRPSYAGGLGFDMKWDMGWMHDTLDYLALDPILRTYHHNALTFRRLYAYSEDFVLALSHDEVVYGKRSLLGKMPGDGWQPFAGLRLLLGCMYAQPGKKLLFMGGEFGQWREWNHDRGLDWHVLGHAPHLGIQRWVADLNALYRSEPALHELDFDPAGFEWIDHADAEQSIISFLRRGTNPDDCITAVFNFTPVGRSGYRVGLPRGGPWHEVLNSAAREYGGDGDGNFGAVDATPTPWQGRPASALLRLPPLGVVFLKPRA